MDTSPFNSPVFMSATYAVAQEKTSPAPSNFSGETENEDSEAESESLIENNDYFRRRSDIDKRNLEDISEDGAVKEYEVALKYLGFGFFHILPMERQRPARSYSGLCYFYGHAFWEFYLGRCS